MPTSTKRYTLPHTGITLTVPVAAGGYQEMDTRDGVAHSARLIINGTYVGKILNAGTGGPTYLDTTNEHRDAWNALVDGARDRGGRPMDEEQVANTLTTEAEFTTDIDRVRRRRTEHAIRLTIKSVIYDGTDLVEQGEDLVATTVKFSRSVTITPETVTYLFKKTQLPDDTLRADVWDGHRWIPFYPRAGE